MDVTFSIITNQCLLPVRTVIYIYISGSYKVMGDYDDSQMFYAANFVK